MALLCATDLGQGFVRPHDLNIFFAVDSHGAGQLAREVASELGVQLFASAAKPLHSDSHQGKFQASSPATSPASKTLALASAERQEQFQAMWGDFVTLLGARGLVTAGNEGSSLCNKGSSMTYGFSDYSQTPAQYSLMPFAKQRIIRKDGVYSCLNVTRQDVSSII